MSEPAVELRSCIYLDQLQPQTMCYLGSWIKGRLPRAGMAAQIIEVAPGLDIEPLTDIALKHDRVEAGILFVERQFGYLEFHSQNPAAVRSATSALLDALDVSAQSAAKPKVLARKVISRVDHQHAFLVNRNRIGSMLLPGESLFVLEVQPASYAILATNEADPAARLRRVQQAMNSAKEQFAAIPAEVLQDFTQFAPPAIAARAMRMYSSLRIADRMNPPFNLVISNVPGPQMPLYSAGARLEHFYPVSTLVDGQGLNMTVQSYNGNLDFGFVADRELVPDLWVMTELLHDEMREQIGRAHV